MHVVGLNDDCMLASLLMGTRTVCSAQRTTPEALTKISALLHIDYYHKILL